MLVKVYELRDPRDEKKCPRYVGITKLSLKTRLQEHLSIYGLKAKTYRSYWIKSLLKDGIKPTIHLIEEVEEIEYAYEVEKYWIKEFKVQGYKLTNGTEGGGGLLGMTHSDKTKEKLRKMFIGKPLSEETKLKMSIARIGRKLSTAHKNNISKASKIATSSKEVREQIGIRSCKPVRITYDTGIIVEYPSLEACYTSINRSRKALYKYIKVGRSKNLKFTIELINK